MFITKTELDKMEGIDLLIQDKLEENNRELKGIVEINNRPGGSPVISCVHLTPIKQLVCINEWKTFNQSYIAFTEVDPYKFKVISVELREYVSSLMEISREKLFNNPIIYETSELAEIHSLILDIPLTREPTEEEIEEVNSLVYKAYIRLT